LKTHFSCNQYWIFYRLKFKQYFTVEFNLEHCFIWNEKKKIKKYKKLPKEIQRAKQANEEKKVIDDFEFDVQY
jgi:hypothetical protein